MRTLYAPTEAFIKTEQATLGVDALAGSSVTLTLLSNDGIGVNTYIAIGYEGSELCELQKVTGIAGSTLATVATLKFNHKAGETVTIYRFNKRKFYGSETRDGSYSELTSDGSPKDIQVDDPTGTLMEYSGSTYYYFKATYFNSTTSEESSISDAEPALADESTRYASIWGIRKMAGLAGNPFYSDIRIEQKRLQAESEVKASLSGRYVLPLTTVPALINGITEMLAAGSIDYEEFGKDSEGLKWIQDARSQLKAIRNGSMTLVDADDIELARHTKVDRFDGLPNNSTEEKSMFKIDQKF